MLSPYVGGEFKITSIYGMRTLNGETAMHSGIDCVGLSSKEVCAVAPGKVITSRIVTDKSNTTWQWGNYVCVQGEDGKLIYYCHMKSRAVKVGDRVKVGDVLGIEGNTGYSFGAHLHLEVREGRTPINAAEYIGIPNEKGAYKVTDEKEIKLDELDKAAGENYHSIDDVPEWARGTIEKLTSNGILKGDECGDLKLSYQMIRLLVMLDRSNVFG